MYILTTELKAIRLDTKDLILHYHGVGNQALEDKLYKFIIEKFDWRFWSVAVYDDMWGFDNQNMWQHGGTVFLHEHDKNIIIATQSKNHASRFNKNNADKLLEKVEKDVFRNYCLIRPDRAFAMVNSMKRISGVGNNYLPYALRLALLYGHNLAYNSLYSHTSARIIVNRTICCKHYCVSVVRYDYVNLCLYIYYVNLFWGASIGYSPSTEDTILK